jgi:hypothetical protein
MAMTWYFKYTPDREFPWEAYIHQDKDVRKIFSWCWQTFDHPDLVRRWDYQEGWIKFCKEEDVTLFLLRWS